MFVNVGADGSVALVEPEDLKSFKLVAAGALADTALARALDGIAGIDGEHAWVSADWVRRESPLAGSESWQAGLAAMLDYAGSKGWLRASDGAIRAHVERR